MQNTSKNIKDVKNNQMQIQLSNYTVEDLLEVLNQLRPLK